MGRAALHRPHPDRADPATTLKRIADIGYGELEVLQATLPVVAPIAPASRPQPRERTPRRPDGKG